MEFLQRDYNRWSIGWVNPIFSDDRLWNLSRFPTLDVTVFGCDKNYQMFTLLKEKQYQVTFLCEKNESTILHKNHQSIPNKPWQKIFCGLCSLNKRNGIAFMSWLHSFMTKTKVSCYKCWHCKRKTKVSSYVPLREKQKYHFTSLNWKSKKTNLYLITPDKRYFAVSVLWISETQ